MGFPFESLSWDAVTGAMYMGAGGSAPMIYTLVSAVACIATLWVGHRNEHKLYDNY